MFHIIKKILNNNFSSIIISIILGIGLASLFKNKCTGDKCLKFKGPSLDNIKNTIYLFDNECYIFSEKAIVCDKKEKSIEFA